MNLQEKLQQRAATFEAEEDLIEKNNNVFNLSVADPPVIDVVPNFAISLAEAKQRLQMLQEFVKDMLVDGVDYGYIPGCQKPSLLKPGAEKLCDIFGFSKQFEVIDRVVDWEKGVFAYEVKAIMINKRTSLIEAEGLGSCNSIEQKYRQKDGFSIANTILKMAKKRALIDAVLSATRSSSFFTQDVEEMEPIIPHPPTPPRAITPPRASVPTRPAASATPGKFNAPPPIAGSITQPQLRKIQTLCAGLGMTNQDSQGILQETYGVLTAQQLSKSQASTFIQHLLELQG